ncbi:hypothetical protein ADK34_01040 [Streptomyces viridochromogenes]|uniref:Uncharacterized protein n=1 Tax=Streptomyces viridochromogenes TaxID=1938 RepID=A0A0L8LES1_STRVR|nr:hypothetical protein ADK34_01040 [Streptomyces viridochromogenes]
MMAAGSRSWWCGRAATAETCGEAGERVERPLPVARRVGLVVAAAGDELRREGGERGEGGKGDGPATHEDLPVRLRSTP